MGDLVVGIDVGTTKIAAIVGEVRADDVYVVGVGIEPSRGMKRGVVTDIALLAQSIGAAVHKAERSSGYDISRAFVSLAGSQVKSTSSVGSVGLVPNRGIRAEDMEKALDSARTIAVPHTHEIVAVIPRSFAIDGHPIRSPLGMFGFRLDVEVCVITTLSTVVSNLEQAVRAAGVFPDRFILNALAAGDCVLTAEEREMGVAVIDIGGGTSDLAIYCDGVPWFVSVVPIGGDLVTNDITHLMHVPFDAAESVKLQHGHAVERDVSDSDTFVVQPFGEGMPTQVHRRELAYAIEKRTEELFEHVRREIKHSGLDDMLRAGAVITGGGSQLSGIKDVAARVLDCPVRLARPDRLTGMADSLRTPAYSTSVGLLRLGLQMDSVGVQPTQQNGNARPGGLGRLFGGLVSRLLPEDGDKR
jgi:cell division protein FtsA